MRNLLKRKSLLILSALSITAGLIAVGCGGNGEGMGSSIGNGLDSLGRNTGAVVGKVGSGISSIPGGFSGNTGGGQADLGTLITVGSKFSDAWSMDNPERQQELGQSVACAITNQYTLSADQNANDYVNMVGLTIGSICPRPEIEFAFGVLETPEVGAYSTPGGFIFITRGALQMTKDESELAGVLAHEVAHVVLNHGIEQVKSAKWNDAFVSAGEMRSAQLRQFESITDNAAKTFLTAQHSQAQESTADGEAVKYLVAAGYDPNGLTRFLQRLQTQTGAGGLENIMKTHPGTADRVRHVQTLATQSGATGVTLGERFGQWIR